MREAGDGLEGFPDPGPGGSSFSVGPEPIYRVRITVDRVPERNQPPGLGKEQKQDPIDDDQGFVEEARG